MFTSYYKTRKMMTKTFDITNQTINGLYSDSNAQTLNISPRWQRGQIWTIQKQRELIISIIRNIPIPAIYTYLNDETGQMELLDGKQRLTTIFKFLDSVTNKSFFLTCQLLLEYDLQDKFENFCNSTKHYYFHDLKNNEQNKFKNYKIAVNVLRGQWDDSDKADICYRVQKGVQHTNGENLYGKRQKNNMINKIAEIYDIHFADPTDKRKHYFNAFCKMYYIYCDIHKTFQSVSNQRINRWYDKYESTQYNAEEEETFIKLLQTFVKQFPASENYKGPVGYVTLFVIWFVSCDQDTQKAEQVFTELVYYIETNTNTETETNTSISISPEIIHSEIVRDIIANRTQSTIDNNGKIKKHTK